MSNAISTQALLGPCPPHHWRVESPHGPTSRGVCAKCGDERTFSNYEEDRHDWARWEWRRPRLDEPIAEVNDLSDLWGGRR